MAARSGRRQVIVSPAALESLREIWLWSAERFGASRADDYLRFLDEALSSLADPQTGSRPVPKRPDLRYLLILRRRGGHGHLAVFQVVDDQVTVLRLFHTAQDWQTKLSEEKSPE